MVDHEKEKGKNQGRTAGLISSSPRRMPELFLFPWKFQMPNFLLSTKQALFSCLKEFILLTRYGGKQNLMMWIISGLLVKALQNFVPLMQNYHTHVIKCDSHTLKVSVSLFFKWGNQILEILRSAEIHQVRPRVEHGKQMLCPCIFTSYSHFSFVSLINKWSGLEAFIGRSNIMFSCVLC